VTHRNSVLVWASLILTFGCSALLGEDFGGYERAECDGLAACAGATSSGGTSASGGSRAINGSGGLSASSLGGSTSASGGSSASRAVSGNGGTTGSGGLGGMTGNGLGGGTGGGGVSDTGGSAGSGGGDIGGSAGSGGSDIGGSAGSAGAGGVAKPPSCASLQNTCGPNADDDCCASDAVPGGFFLMGRDNGNDFEGPAHAATLSSFQLDRYEATVGRFRRFVDAYDTWLRPTVGDGAYRGDPSNGWQSDWNRRLPPDSAALRSAASCGFIYQGRLLSGTWSELASAQTLAIGCLDWYTAFAFCIWDGGRLPTEAEWEYAAAGGAERRRYPWGDTWQDGVANYGTYNRVISVGTAGAGAGRARFGHYDMIGNVWEWTRDNWDVNFYRSAPREDPLNISGSAEPIMRGATFTASRPEDNQTFSRAWAERMGFNPAIGVRCARD